MFGDERVQDMHGLPVQWGGSVLAAFTAAEHMRAGAQMDVADLESGEFGDPQSGGDGKLEHGAVASSGLGHLVRCCQQRGDLGVGEVADLVAGPAFRWDRQDPADGGQVFGVVARCVGEERVDRCQAGVAGGDTVAPLRFQAGEESVDQLRVDLRQIQTRWRGPGRLGGVTE